MNQEPTTQDILEAVQVLSTHIDGQFTDIKGQITDIKGQITGIRGEVTDIRGEVTDIRAQMVTKAYLDEKFTDLRGDLTVLIRKEDHKLLELVAILKEKQVLNADDVKRVLALEPFPSLSL